MKVYKANNELVEILQKQGFIETTSNIDKKKGKKRFKLSKQARKEIYFDYINIRILNSIHGQDSRTTMTESELKSLLLYFKLNSADFKEFDSSRKFDFKKIEKRLVSLKIELNNLTKFNLHKPRRNKIERILKTYENIILNEKNQ